jgi:rod shape-determining protein MreC
VAKPRRLRRPRTTLLILVLISITIITLDARGDLGSFTSGLKSVASDAFSPIRSGVDAVVRPIGSFLAGTVHYGAVREQNQKLQAEIGSLRQQMAEQGNAAQALKQLQALSALNNLPTVQSLHQVKAEVIDFNSSNFAATIDIGVGRDEGVAVGMPVMGSGGATGGLIGQVVVSNKNTATVRLLTDGQSTVGVAYGPSLYAVLQGQGAGKPLIAQYIPANTPIPSGPAFVTSGLQDAEFPPGLPVAQKVSVKNGNSANDETVTLKPVADFDHLRYVSVLLWGPATSGSSAATGGP